MNRPLHPGFSSSHPAPLADEAAWAATHVQQNANRYSATEPEAANVDIGRAVAEGQYELFVSCEPGIALQQQFDHLQPEFIALHDVATNLSTRLLAGVAAASGGKVQTMAIRRQGYGNTLAVLRFVELRTAGGPPVRLYSSDVEADTLSRQSIARVLLAYSRLGVVLVGDVSPHHLQIAFQPLQDEMIRGPWRNRDLLLLPLAAAGPLATLGSEIARGSGVDVRTAPTIARPADAWNFISSTWGRLRAQMQPPVSVPVSAPMPMEEPAAEEPTSHASEPLPLRPMPEVPQAHRQPVPARDPLTRYVQQLIGLTGMVSCCVFEVSTGRTISHAGASPGADELADHGAELMASMLVTSQYLGFGHTMPDACITLGAHHLLLRAVPRHPGLALHAVLDKTANITLARLQVTRMDALFDEPWHMEK